MSKKRPPSLRQKSSEKFSWEAAHRSCVSDIAKVAPSAVAWKPHRWYWFWRHKEAMEFNCALELIRSPERSLNKLWLNPQWHLKTQDWRCHAEKLRFDIIKRVTERLLVKVQPGYRRPWHFGDPRPMRSPPRTAISVKWSLQKIKR